MDVRIQNETYYTMVEEALYPSISDLNLNETSSLVHDRILDEFDEKRTFNEIKLTSCLLNGDLEYRSSMDSGFAAILFYPFTCPDTNIFDSKRVLSTFLSSFSSFPIIRTIFAVGKCAFYSNSHSNQVATCSSAKTSIKSYSNPSENDKQYSSNNNELNNSTAITDQKVSLTCQNSSVSFNQNSSNIQVKKHGSYNSNNKVKASTKNGKTVDINVKLQNTIKKLTADLHSIKAAENQLRLQLSQIEAESKDFRDSYTVQRKENEILSNEIAKLSIRNKAEKSLLNQLESQIVSERKARIAIEESITKLKNEKKQLPVNAKNNNNKISNNASSSGQAGGKKSENRQNCTCGDEFSCRQKLKRLENDLKNMQIQINQREDSLKMNSVSKNVWHSSNGNLSKQNNLDEARKSLLNRINLASNERVKLNSKLREYSNLQEELMAAYKKSHNSICELKNNISQRNATINQLQEKMNNFEAIHKNKSNNILETSCKVSGNSSGTVNSFETVENSPLSFYNETRCNDPIFLKKQQNLFRNDNNKSQTSDLGSGTHHLNHDSWGFLSSKHVGQSYNRFSNSVYDNQHIVSYKSISPPLISNDTLLNIHGSSFEQNDSLTNGAYRNQEDNHGMQDYMGSSLSSVLNQCSINDIGEEDVLGSNNLDSIKASSPIFGNYPTTSPNGGRLSGILSNFKNHNFSSPVLRQCAKNALLENYSSTDQVSNTATLNCSTSFVTSNRQAFQNGNQPLETVAQPPIDNKLGSELQGR